MPSDRSRRTDRPHHGYTGVVAQQGRVILDRDFNAGQGFTAARIAADALHFVGPCGTPDDGFRISLPQASPPSPPPPFWSPPVTPPMESPPVTPGGVLDFLVSPGTMYVGGERAEFAAEQDGNVITYSYFDQPDWLLPVQPSPNVGRELVYLELTEQEVSAVEDPDLLEVALGGPDTTQRLKLVRRVKRMAAPADDCATAWEIAVRLWAITGWQFDPATMRLSPTARLMVGFTQDASAGDPCDPVATGGYLGADNQLIRVRVAGPRDGPKLLWGYDNASFLYPVTSVSPDATTLTLAYDPPDAMHVPQTGQIVEVLTTAGVLGIEPTAANPGAPNPALRVVAEADGILRGLAQPYGPTVPGGTTNAIVLDSPLPNAVAQSTMPLFLRIWQAELPLTLGAANPLTDPVTGTSTGVTVTVSEPSGATLADGAFWLIAVRPATPQGVYPESLLVAAKPPDGPRRWVCPLAVIDWRAGTVTDCRNSFENLVTLSRRKQGCCTVSIDPQDVTATTTLQTLIDRAVTLAQTVTVCLSPGKYELPTPLRLTSNHDGLTLESCGGRALLLADPNADAAVFADGLIVLTGLNAVTLRGLALRVPYAPSAFTQELANSYSGFGLRAVNATRLTLHACAIDFPNDAPATTAYLFGSAVFLQGNCSGLLVHDCAFGSAIAPTYTAFPSTERNVRATDPVRTIPDVTGGSLIDHLAAASRPSVAPAAGQIASPSRLEEAVNRFTTTFGPYSPVVGKAALLTDRVRASLDALVNAAAPVQTITTMVGTAGIIACDYVDGRTTLDCSLGDTTIRDTVLSNLTFAVSLSATATKLRLQDNRVDGCVAGLWYLLPEAAVPASPAANTTGFYPEVFLFGEFSLCAVLFEISPPPQSPADATRLAAPVESNATAGVFALIIRGNEVDPTAGQSQAAGATTALLLALNGEQRTIPETFGELSVIVADNYLRSASGANAAAALLTLPSSQPCAITGNVIVNIGLALQDGNVSYGPSLWLTVAYSGESTAPGTLLLTVTGNTLFNKSDLRALIRYGSNPPAGWESFNSDGL